MKGTRPLTGPALTNDLCGQNVKVNVKVNTNAVLANAEINKLANAEIKTLTLTLNILTAFIRLGRARPEGAGCPPNYY